MNKVFDNPVYISLGVLFKHFPAGTRFAFCTEYGPEPVKEVGYDGNGEVYFVRERESIAVHYPGPDAVLMVSKEDYQRYM